MPTVLVGADIDGKPNFMTAAFVGIVNYKPSMVACGLNPSHRTCEGIESNRAFSLCVPSADMVEVVDWCGLTSGKKVDKSEVFKVFRGEVAGAPMIEDFPLCAECRLMQATPYGVDTLYVAEIVSVHARADCLDNGRPNWLKISPLLFTFPEPSYWKLGDYVAKAWHAGREYEPKKPISG